MKALVIGGTGLTGKILIEKLLADERCDHIIAPVRKEIISDNPKLEYRKIDFKFSEMEEFEGDVAFSCLGTTMGHAGSRDNFRLVDHSYNLNFARACSGSGVRKFIIISAIGANSRSRVFYSRIKGELEDDLRDLNFDSLVIIRPSLLEGPREQFRLSELISRKIMKIINPVLIGNLRKYRSVKVEDVADAMISAAFRDTEKVELI